MPEPLADPNVRLLALVDLLLVLKMIALANYTSFLRVRRAHRNDLENILPFFVVSFLYVLTKPSYGAAAIYFWGFLAARVLHSIFYIRGAQPHRTIAFAVGA